MVHAPGRSAVRGQRSRYGPRRAFSLAAVYLLIGLHVLHWKLAGRTLAPLELNEVLHTVHRGIVTAGFLFMGLTMAATLVFGRFFCGWGCHLLALQDGSAWLLARAGIRPIRLRSRALAWIPAAGAAYLFAWPQVQRAIQGRPFPGLHVQGDAGGWGSFATDNLFRNLPGPWLTLLTFLVCGAVFVYLLGTRSFCEYICPWGALFRAADAAAPGRIALAGECDRCGACSAACWSGVRVEEEALRYGAVVDPACLKDLDCVSACPRQALRFGFVSPPLARGLPPALRPRRPSAFSRGEEALLGASFLVSLATLRGLYDAVPLLLAMASAALFAFAWILCLRIAVRRDVSLQGHPLRQGGRLSAAGWSACGTGLLLAVFTAHSGWVHWQYARGKRLFDALDRPGATLADAREALVSLERARRWGLLHPAGLDRRLALLRSRLAPGPGAIAPQPADARALLGIGVALARRGQLEEAERFLSAAASLAPDSPVVQHDLAVVRAGLKTRSDSPRPR